MKIDEFKKELGDKNFYKLCVYGSLVLLTIIAYFIKGSNIEININWELLGFVGVIITIIYTEKSRIKQNQYDYKKEKITDEQIEFKQVVKKVVDLLDFAQVMQDFYHVNTTNYTEVTFKVNTYRTKLAVVENDIRWYYKEESITMNSEVKKFLNLINKYRYYYDKKLEEYNNVVLKLGALDILNDLKPQESLPAELKQIMTELNIESKTSKQLKVEIVNEQKNIFMEMVKYRSDNIKELYKQAHLMIDERDNLMKEELKEIKE